MVRYFVRRSVLRMYYIDVDYNDRAFHYARANVVSPNEHR